jgi:signal transduction histidine kinase
VAGGAAILVLGLLLILSALAGAQVAGRPRGAVATFVLSPLHPATWHAALAIVLGFWVELFAFIVVISLFSGGASLLVVLVGVVFIGLGVEASRVFARFERRRAMRADGRPLRAHEYRPYGSGGRDLLFAVFLDVNRWLDVVYVFVAFPLVVLELIVIVTLWAGALALLSLPLWVTSSTVLAAPGPSFASAVGSFLGLVLGVLLAMIAASVTRGLMALHRAVIEGLLCESEQRALARRVAALETSRRTVIDTEASELRRIERDLHDGAQQRLVMLTIDLGLAGEKIDTDPARARELVAEAQDQARQALAELRDLVRGIAPAILLDRGLVPALSAIAGRAPVQAIVSSTLPEGARLSDAVERAAYFVVAESLANVAKHASATRCEISCRQEGTQLIVEIRDDGTGGARIVPGGGLAGLVGRVEALDGSLTVESPAGGPTVVRAAIPALPAVALPPPAIPGWNPG